MLNTPKDQAVSLIKRSEKILCVTRVPARPDGMACVLASQILFSRSKRDVMAIVPSEGISKQLSFLPNHDKIETSLGEAGDFVISISTKKTQVERVKYTIEEDSVDILVTPKSGNFSPTDVLFRHNLANFDLILVFDAPTLESLGTVFEDHTELFAGKPVINISSRAETEMFGQVNLVDVARSSASEIFLEIVESIPELRELLDEDISTVLLTGIIANTGSFLETNTSASGFAAASRLQALGARQSEIIDHFFKQKSFPTLKIWGKILGNLQFDPMHKFTWSRITQSDLLALETVSENVDCISDEILRFVENAELSILFIEEEKRNIAQVRSANSGFDWSDFSTGFECISRENGIDVLVEAESLADAESFLLYEIVKFQKERLGISEDVPLQRLQVQKESAEMELKNILPKSKTEVLPKIVPKAPEHIPFIAPFQPHEHTGKIEGIFNKSNTKELVPEKIVLPGKKGIPEWLKRSFPEN